MPTLPVTMTSTAILLLFAVPLSLQVTFRRIKLGNVVFGDADDPVLRRRIRAHANFTEYVPTALVALALLELSQALPRMLVIALGASFVANRILHAAGMLFGRTPAIRAVAMMATHGFFVVGGVALLYGVATTL